MTQEKRAQDLFKRILKKRLPLDNVNFFPGFLPAPRGLPTRVGHRVYLQKRHRLLSFFFEKDGRLVTIVGGRQFTYNKTPSTTELLKMVEEWMNKE